LLLANIAGEAIAGSQKVRPHSIDSAVARLGMRVLGFALAVTVTLYGAQLLGLPVVPLLAGLGVGGLAVALAAQPTIENFIAGLTLYADRPVRVGDFCRFGDTVGTIEQIGLRSTRIRTLDNTVVSVPNGEFSKARLENYSKRERLWYHPRIRLRYETTPDQVRFILVEIHKVLYAHPKVIPDPARVRFVAFGEYSLELDVFAYINVTDYGEYLEVAEDLNLRIMDVVKAAGSELSVPARIEYQIAKEPMSEDRTRHAETQVKQWRTDHALYVPRFPPEKIAELRGSLEYPPAGAPAHKPGYK
jgi:MscS family membrane protein